MLGRNIRTRVAQTATMTGATTINVFGGSPAVGHKTFVQAFNPPGILSEGPIPILVEKADGSWQTALATLTGDSGAATTAVLTMDTLLESSNADNSAITLTNGDSVNVSIAPIGALFMGMVTTPRMPDETTLLATGYFPALAAGPFSYAAGKHSMAVGHDVTAGGYGAAILGVGGSSLINMGLNLASGREYDAFGASLVHTSAPFIAGRHKRTTNATPAELTYIEDDYTTEGAAGLYCEGGLSYFRAIVSAISDTGVRRVWSLEWVIETEPDYSASALVGTVTKTNIYNGDGGAAAWDVDVNVNSGANTCAIEVTGAAATNIAWGARIDGFANTLWQN